MYMATVTTVCGPRRRPTHFQGCVYNYWHVVPGLPKRNPGLQLANTFNVIAPVIYRSINRRIRLTLDLQTSRLTLKVSTVMIPMIMNMSALLLKVMRAGFAKKAPTEARPLRIGKPSFGGVMGQRPNKKRANHLVRSLHSFNRTSFLIGHGGLITQARFYRFGR